MTNATRAGYNVPDVKWHGIDEETLLKVENDAEDVKGLFIEGFMIFDQVDEDGNFAEDDDDVVDIIIHPWADAERIGNSNSRYLLNFDISYFGRGSYLAAAPWLLVVFRGLARNRSIEHLKLSDMHNNTVWSPFEIITPFLKHNHNLRSIQLDSIDLKTHFESFLSALSLCDKNQLARISLSKNNLEAGQVTRFIKALREQRNLLELEITDNSISRNGCLELSKLLQHPRSKIYCLSAETTSNKDE